MLQNAHEDAKTGRVFHFRWVDLWTAGVADRLLCVPIEGSESIPNGKARKEYVKRHPMESCYFATPITGPTLAVKRLQSDREGISQLDQSARIREGQASIVFVVTAPAGARIWADGAEAGASPMAFVLARHGNTPRSIKVTLDGYKAVERQLVPDGRTIPITLTLEPN